VEILYTDIDYSCDTPKGVSMLPYLWTFLRNP
jgi:hypothetical protein